MDYVRRENREIQAAFVTRVRAGSWTPARHVDVIAVLAEVVVDLMNAHFEPGPTVFELAVSCSFVRLIVPPGLAVDVDLQVLAGSVRRDPDIPEVPVDADEPFVRVTGHILLSRLTITRSYRVSR
jgi:hypothetical protein